MTSIQGLLVGYLLRKNLNTNISNKKHSRARHCWQKRFFNADRLPDTFLCNSETTPGGTAFQRVFCKETTPSDRLILYFHGGSYIAGLSPVYQHFAQACRCSRWLRGHLSGLSSCTAASISGTAYRSHGSLVRSYRTPEL